VSVPNSVALTCCATHVVTLNVTNVSRNNAHRKTTECLARALEFLARFWLIMSKGNLDPDNKKYSKRCGLSSCFPFFLNDLRGGHAP
jgi:hypothetical protein